MPWNIKTETSKPFQTKKKRNNDQRVKNLVFSCVFIWRYYLASRAAQGKVLWYLCGCCLALCRGLCCAVGCVAWSSGGAVCQVQSLNLVACKPMYRPQGWRMAPGNLEVDFTGVLLTRLQTNPQGPEKNACEIKTLRVQVARCHSSHNIA